jgi:hypothetical protein
LTAAPPARCTRRAVNLLCLYFRFGCFGHNDFSVQF